MMMSLGMTWTHGMCATCQWVLDRQILKCQEHDMCHLSEWATCSFLMFRHGDLLSGMGGGAMMVTVVHGTIFEI
jgi:hypothetical protein